MRGVYDVSPSELSRPRLQQQRSVVFGPERPRRRIVLLSLNEQKQSHHLNGSHLELIQSLNRKATVEQVSNLSTALSALSSPLKTNVVIASISHISEPELLGPAEHYVRSGGTLLLTAAPCTDSPDSHRAIFDLLGLPWKVNSSSPSTSSSLPHTFILNTRTSGLETRYFPATVTLHADLLANVGLSQAVYLPERNDRTTGDTSKAVQTPVAFTSVGRGKAGYLGSAAVMEELPSVVRAMCGMLG